MRDADADTDLSELVATVRDHLAATATLPVREDASRWLGEAEAVAGDLSTGPLPDDEVVRTRLGHVDDLLGHVEETGDAEADAHVDAVRDALADALAAVGGRESSESE